MAYRKEDVIKALDASMGAVYLAAERLGCSHTTILAWVKRSPDVAAVRDKWRGKLIDRAEIALYEKVQMKDNWAIGFALAKLGRDRGYIERQQHEIDGNLASPTTYAEWIQIETERNKKKST